LRETVFGGDNEPDVRLRHEIVPEAHVADLNVPPVNDVRASAAAVADFVDQALAQKATMVKLKLGKVSPEVEAKVNQLIGVDVTGWQHVIDNYAIHHTMRRHGRASTEVPRGQSPITLADWRLVPDILSAPDRILHGGQNKIGRDVIVTEKRIGDHYYYVEEVRRGKRQLAAQTFYKRPVSDKGPASGGQQRDYGPEAPTLNVQDGSADAFGGISGRGGAVQPESSAALAAFDDPDGAGAARQLDALRHDVAGLDPNTLISLDVKVDGDEVLPAAMTVQ
jgi:hypothetical protein